MSLRYLNPLLLFAVSWVSAWDRTDYVLDNGKEWSLRPSLQYTELAIEVDSTNTSYSPNNPTKLCLQIAWKGFSIEGGISLPDDERSEKRVNTQAFDVQLHQYYNYFVADLYYQHYRGFYAVDKDSISDLPGLDAYHVGSTGLYVFSGKRFSHQAAFDLTQRQIRSAGSWLLGGGIHYSRFTGAPDSSTGYLNFTNWHAGLNGGYAYNWVFLPNWLLHGSLIMGLHGSNQRITEWFDKEFKIEEAVMVRVGVNRNGTHWGYGLGVILDALFMHQQNIAINSTAAKIDIFVMRRFSLE